MKVKREISAAPVLDQELLEKVHRAIKEIFAAVVEVCDRHNITYFVVEGTLLGTIRHHGFIPWDDDVDIAMPFSEMERFLQYAKLELPGFLMLKPCFSRAHKHLPAMDYTKVFYSGHGMQGNDLPENCRVWIDIFLLVGLPANALLRRAYYYRIMCRKIITRLCEPDTISMTFWRNQKPFRKWIIRSARLLKLGRILSYDKECEKLKRRLLKYPYETSQYSMAYPTGYGKREIFPREWYGEGCRKEFEGIKVNTPSRFHEILTSLYGDYMKFPPIEKRRASHITMQIADDWQQAPMTDRNGGGLIPNRVFLFFSSEMPPRPLVCRGCAA